MKNNRVFNNVSWIIVCKIAQSGFAIAINALTARYFGPSSYGLISYAASLVAFVTPIMTMGTSDVLVGEVIKNPENEGEILGTAITMTMGSALVCVAGLFTFVNFANLQDKTTAVVVFLYSLLLVAQSLEQIQYWFHAKYLSKFVSIASFFAYLAISIYKIVLLACQKNIYWFAVSNSLDHLLIALVLLWLYKRNDGQKLCFSLAAARVLWKQGKYYIIPELMGLVLAQSDRVMLRFMCGDTEVGLYSVALSVAGMPSFVFAAIITSFRPVILEHKTKCAEKYETNMARLYGIVIYLSLLQSAVLMFFSRLVIGILYGQTYVQAIPMLQIAVWYTIFSYIGGVRTVWFLAEGKQNFLWAISFPGMILNIALNYILISRFGGVGAAIATLATQIFTNIIIIYIVKPLRPNITYIAKGMSIKNIIGRQN